MIRSVVERVLQHYHFCRRKLIVIFYNKSHNENLLELPTSEQVLLKVCKKQKAAKSTILIIFYPNGYKSSPSLFFSHVIDDVI